MKGGKELRSTQAGKGDFLIACLCAEWCGACREYHPGFDALASRISGAEFVWIDVEDEPEIVGEIDIENFPTIVIQRGHDVLFCGSMLPHINQLERLVLTFLEQTPEESARYAGGNEVRRAWQGVADLRSRLDF